MGCNPGGSQEPWPVVIARSSNSWSRARPCLRRPLWPKSLVFCHHLLLQRRLESRESLDFVRGEARSPIHTHPSPACETL